MALWRNRVLDRPDPENPERVFWDGEDAYSVDVLPALMPVLGTQDGAESIIRGLLWLGLWMFVSRIFDPRWKLVVSRCPKRRAVMFHPVHVEFFDSADAAETRARELVRAWMPGRYSRSIPFTALELDRARRQTRLGDAVPAHQALKGFTLTTLRARFCIAGGAGMLGLGLLTLPFGPPLVWLGLFAAAVAFPFLLAGSVLWLMDRARRLARTSR